jgi:hypothetical protein
LAQEPAWIAQFTPQLSGRRRSGSQLGKVQVGGSTASRQTAAATDTLEIDMPPRHQGNPGFDAVSDGHPADYATFR